MSAKMTVFTAPDEEKEIKISLHLILSRLFLCRELSFVRCYMKCVYIRFLELRRLTDKVLIIVDDSETRALV